MTELVEARIIIGPTITQAALLDPSLLAAVRDLMAKGTLYLEARGKLNCPVRSGFMRNSHISEIGFPVSRVRVLASYGGFVHDGTRHQRANPWLSRSRDETVAWLSKQKIEIKKV